VATPVQAASAASLVESVLRARRSVRAFRPDPVSRQRVLDILGLASTAPSNSNTQPWRVHVLTGNVKTALSEELLAAHESDALPPPAHFPAELPQRLRANQEAFGRLYYAAAGIDSAWQRHHCASAGSSSARGAARRFAPRRSPRSPSRRSGSTRVSDAEFDPPQPARSEPVLDAHQNAVVPALVRQRAAWVAEVRCIPAAKRIWFP
jgi:nitroreductase